VMSEMTTDTICDCWVQTVTGGMMDLEKPTPEAVHAHDICVALARLPRFNGHTLEPFSVAQHSLLVLRILDDEDEGTADPGLRLAALLHDAHEAYMGDVVSPVASLPALREPIAALKDRLQRVIHVAFGLPEVLPVEWRRRIGWCDLVALATEKRDLMAPEPQDWNLRARPWHQTLDLQTRYELGRLFPPMLTGLAREVAS